MNKIYNTLTLFTNKLGGKPIIKDGMPVKKQDGTNLLNASFNGIITLKEGLPTDEWIVYYHTKTSAGEFTALQTTANIDDIIYYEKINQLIYCNYRKK